MSAYPAGRERERWMLLMPELNVGRWGRRGKSTGEEQPRELPSRQQEAVTGAKDGYRSRAKRAQATNWRVEDRRTGWKTGRAGSCRASWSQIDGDRLSSGEWSYGQRQHSGGLETLERFWVQINTRRAVARQRGGAWQGPALCSSPTSRPVSR